METGVLVHYLESLIQSYTRFYDLICFGIPYYEPDLEVLNTALNREFEVRATDLKAKHPKGFEIVIPYRTFNISEVRKTWPKDFRPKVQLMLFDIKMAYQSSPDSRLPQDALVFSHTVTTLINAYELRKFKYEAEELHKFIGRQNEETELQKSFDAQFDIG